VGHEWCCQCAWRTRLGVDLQRARRGCPARQLGAGFERERGIDFLAGETEIIPGERDAYLTGKPFLFGRRDLATLGAKSGFLDQPVYQIEKLAPGAVIPLRRWSVNRKPLCA
jgi:hypothetical protein